MTRSLLYNVHVLSFIEDDVGSVVEFFISIISLRNRVSIKIKSSLSNIAMLHIFQIGLMRDAFSFMAFICSVFIFKNMGVSAHALKPVFFISSAICVSSAIQRWRFTVLFPKLTFLIV